MMSEPPPPAEEGAKPEPEPEPEQDGMPWEKYKTVLLAGCIGNVLEWYDFAVYGGFANELGQLFFPPCEMELPNGQDFSALTADQVSDFCRGNMADQGVFVPFDTTRIKDAAVRRDHCPVRTESFHSCCAWKEDGVSPIADAELGDCVYEPVEQDQLLKSFGVFAGAFIMRPVGGIVMGALGDKFGRKFALQVSIALMLFPSLLLAVLPTYHSVGYAATFGLLLIRMCQGVAAGGELVGSMLCAPLPSPLPSSLSSFPIPLRA